MPEDSFSDIIKHAPTLHNHDVAGDLICLVRRRQFLHGECTRMALMATFLPPPMFPEPSSPRLWAVGHAPLHPPRIDPKPAEDRPEGYDMTG